MEYMQEVFSKIARRYELKGCLSGTMKLGQNLSSSELTALGNFFGLSPLRVNGKEEIRLYFDQLLQNGSESQWLEKIGDALGYPIEVKTAVNNDKHSETAQNILASLLLAYPDLHHLFTDLQEEDNLICSMLSKKSAETVKRHCFKTAEITVFLINNTEPITVSDLGARFYNDSKSLRQGELRTLLVQWLGYYSQNFDLTDDEEYLLAEYHVLHDRLTVNAVLYGPIIYEKNGKTFDWIDQLYRQGEAATLGWSNIQNIDTIYFKDQNINPPDLIACENEAPFTGLMRQKKNACLLFTSGFPSSAVQKVYQLLAPQAANCFHWGDSDPNGLRIAAIMHSLYPLLLYRCDLPTLQQHKDNLLPLTQKQKDTIIHIFIQQPDFPFAEELLFTLENGWLEQESFRF